LGRKIDSVGEAHCNANIIQPGQLLNETNAKLVFSPLPKLFCYFEL
jgi:hypothetical protein